MVGHEPVKTLFLRNVFNKKLLKHLRTNKYNSYVVMDSILVLKPRFLTREC